MALVSVAVVEDTALNLMQEAGACQLNARRFGTSRPHVLAVSSKEFSREASSHGWMVLPPVSPCDLCRVVEMRRPRFVVSACSVGDVKKVVGALVGSGTHFVIKVLDHQVESHLAGKHPEVSLIRTCSCVFGGKARGGQGSCELPLFS